MKVLFVMLLIVVSWSIHAEGKAPVEYGNMNMALNSMAVSIGENGVILKDKKGCLWVIKSSNDTPNIVAVFPGGTKKPMCENDESGGAIPVAEIRLNKQIAPPARSIQSADQSIYRF